MNANYPKIRDTEQVASALEYHGGQRIATETFLKAKEVRKWIAEHPGCTGQEMPEGYSNFVGFLMKRKMIVRKGQSPAKYWVKLA